ncbi:MAG: peptide chain release factor N(5)-glutamine methyltransferase [Candidatus Limnocylindrales bacterium]
MATTKELLEAGIARLSEAGSGSPRLDAGLLLAHANGVDRTAILAHPNAPVGTGPADVYEGFLERRALGEPVAYIRGIKEFHGLAFAVDRRALIPRPETELLVDLAVAHVMQALTSRSDVAERPPLQVVDVGTGSGAIAVALAVALRARRVPAEQVAIVALDVSPEALDLARENAAGHAVGDRLRFVGGDLLPPGTIAWDLVLANLPYVRSDAMATLPVATSFEPSLALDGGPDGLAVVGRLLERLPTSLARDGQTLLEIGADQGESIATLVAEGLPGWSCAVERDLAGLPRVARVSRAGSGDAGAAPP